MSVRRGLVSFLVAGAVLALPVEAYGVQVPDRRTVDRTVPTSDVRRLFRIPVLRAGADSSRVDRTVQGPEIEALFKGLVEVVVLTNGTLVDPDGYVVQLEGGDGVRTAATEVNDTLVAFASLDPGQYEVGLRDLDGCTTPPADPVTVWSGRITRALFVVSCPDLPTSVTVGLARAPMAPRDAVRMRMGGEAEREIRIDSSTTFQILEPGPNQLVLTIPDPGPGLFDLGVDFSDDTPDLALISMEGGPSYTIGPGQTASFRGVGPGSIDLTLTVPEVPRRLPTTVIVDLEGEADRQARDSILIRVGDEEPRWVGVGQSARIDSLSGDSLRVVVSLDRDITSPRDSWHLGLGLGVIAVAATDPTSFVTPTLGLSLVRGEPREETVYLNGQVGYWRSGPSGSDPVLPDDPRPPYRNRTIWTWSVGASLFPRSWGGLGVSAAWVEGRETASEEEKYMNRSRGVAVGPRFRVLTDAPWPSVILGLDVQYGEAEELRLDEPELRWSLTPVLSLSYVLR